MTKYDPGASSVALPSTVRVALPARKTLYSAAECQWSGKLTPGANLASPTDWPLPGSTAIGDAMTPDGNPGIFGVTHFASATLATNESSGDGGLGPSALAPMARSSATAATLMIFFMCEPLVVC